MIIEQEKTYLLKDLPAQLAGCPYTEIIDLYMPASSDHPHMRLRARNGRYELTKKVLIDAADLSRLQEYNTPLTKEEFEYFSQLPHKRLAKRRYKYNHQGLELEIDIFLDNLAGLAVCEAEFDDQTTFDSFQMPSFCLVDITQDEHIAGGLLCGKTLDQVMPQLAPYGYKPIFIE